MMTMDVWDMRMSVKGSGQSWGGVTRPPWAIMRDLLSHHSVFTHPPAFLPLPPSAPSLSSPLPPDVEGLGRDMDDETETPEDEDLLRGRTEVTPELHS